MRRASLLLSLVLLTLFTATSRPATAYEAFFTGNDYMAASSKERLAFLGGVYDTYKTVHEVGFISSEEFANALQRIFDCTAEMNLVEMEALFSAWLEAHREEWDVAAVSSFVFSFDTHCTQSQY